MDNQTIAKLADGADSSKSIDIDDKYEYRAPKLSEFFLITILFMQTRIKAKVFADDTLDSILFRIRDHVSTINP